MPTSTPVSLLKIDRTDGLTVRFPTLTQLTDANAEKVGAEIRNLAEAERGGHLRIDLGNIVFLTSSALGQFLSLHKKFRSAGGRLTLGNVHPMVREVFTITRLDQIIEI